MACILQPKCNFPHGFFRCHLPVETVDVEVKITSMQGIHTFRRERMCQIIKINAWSTRLHPHPTLIKKVRMYLELRVAMHQGKTKFSPVQGIVREFWKMSGNFHHLTHVGEFCHDIFFR